MLNRPHATKLYKSQSYDNNKFKKTFHSNENTNLPLNTKNSNKKIKNDDSIIDNEDSGGESDWISATEDVNNNNNNNDES